MEKSSEGTDGGQNLTPDYKKILIPVAMSALLGPGAGQFYHRQWKKAVPLALATLLLLIVATVYLVAAAQAELKFLADTQPEKILEGGFEMGLAQEIVRKHSKALSGFKWMLIALWCYSIVDAFLVSKKRTETA